MGRIERQKRELIVESNKRLLGEASYSGIIKKGDDICEIICKRKIAKYGSSGDVVKMIQHLLDSNGFNKDYKGGGMKQYCNSEWPSCDGIFKKHTKDAVEEFQTKFKLSIDGVVGYNTWKAMCDNLKFTGSLPKDDFCKECQCNQRDFPVEREIDTPLTLRKDDYIVDIIELIDCDELKYCVSKYLYQDGDRRSIDGFYKCVSDKNGSFTDQPVKSGCVTSNGRSLCEIKPKKIGDGEMTTAVMGYWYNPITKRCEQTRGGYAPFSQMGKCNECCKRGVS